MEITDEIRRSPQYHQYYYAQQKKDQENAMAAQDARRLAHWAKTSGYEGAQAVEGIEGVGNMPAREGVEASGIYAENFNPRERQLALRNKAMLGSGLPALQEQAMSNFGSMQNSAMSGINQLNLAKYNKANPAAKARKTLKDAADRQRFVDDGSLVFPDLDASKVGGFDPTSNMQDVEYYMNMPEETEKQRADKKLMREAISKTKYLDQGTHSTSMATGEEFSHNLGQVEKDKGAGKHIVDRMNKYPSAAIMAETYITELDSTLSDLQELEDYTSNNNVGYSSYLSSLPETGANKWANMRDTITSRFALDKMMELKNSSPQGSTGFGALNEKEMLVMQQYMGSLEQAQSAPEIKRVIGKIKTLLEGKRKLAARGIKEGDKWYNLNRGGFSDQNAYTDLPHNVPEQAQKQPEAKSVNWEDLD